MIGSWLHRAARARWSTPSGTILPFSFDPDLDLVADPEVVARPELYFNAARLDRSLVISGKDYQRLAEPHVAPITASGEG